MAGAFLVTGFTPRWVAVGVAQTVLYLLPNAVLAAGIQGLGDAGQPLLLAGGGALTVALFALLAVGTLRVTRSLARTRGESVFAVGVVQTAAAFALTVAPLPSLVGGVCGGLVAGLGGREMTEGLDVPRRNLLRSAGVAAGTLGLAGVLGVRDGMGSGGAGPDTDATVDDPLVEALLSTAEERSLAVPGVEGLVSSSFYEVDKNSANPRVNRESWSLRVTGAVEEPTEFDFADIAGRPAHHRFVSLRCVGDPVNGRKTDNALWTGVPITDLVEEAGVDAEEGCCVMLRADDGYYEEFPLEALDGGFLAYGMNGLDLPRGHGYPVRALIPGHWGEINVKWLTEIEILEEPATGYWEKQGWHGTGPVSTVAKIHATDTSGDSVVVGGHAYAGTRGVSAVEVSTDGGETWTEADLSAPLPGAVAADADPADIGGEADDAWRMWRHEYDSETNHEVVARAVEADGTVQPREERSAYPRGATGWVSVEVFP
ncbi:oxidoreductase molybdopterin binding protein [Candidatus Halobonum tyrrellensis G22]|uniref:Oxidoreductase molybdopterin binding protein n=1 Tax=Candidatus Halobonum tyrrellensis G22 TaxID=1324957 RepID=V4HE38_9EURY|nr:oxidoreductase molybdopterin binding protein [Candidatus Halobonum tyrrellensis G22]